MQGRRRADPDREAAAAAPEEPTVIRYMPPQYLTANGQKAFEIAVRQYVVALRAELDRLALDPLSRGKEPEHTAEAVVAARRAYERRLT